MSEIPADVHVAALHEAEHYAQWLHAGNSTGSLSAHAILGLADTIARAILAERERCLAICSERPTSVPTITAAIRKGGA